MNNKFNSLHIFPRFLSVLFTQVPCRCYVRLFIVTVTVIMVSDADAEMIAENLQLMESRHILGPTARQWLHF